MTSCFCTSIMTSLSTRSFHSCILLVPKISLPSSLKKKEELKALWRAACFESRIV